MQNIFNFHNIFFTVRAFVGRFDDWSLRCFIGFNCEGNRKMIWQVSFYYGWLKVIVACYTIGDNVVYGISWVSDLSCWSLKLEKKFIEILRLEKPPFLTSEKNGGDFLRCDSRCYSRLLLVSDIWKYKSERNSAFPNLRIKLGRLPPIWLPVTPGYHWLLIFQNSGEEVSPSENSLPLMSTIYFRVIIMVGLWFANSKGVTLSCFESFS